MRTREQTRNGGIGRRMLAAVVGWFQRLRRAEARSATPVRSDPISPIRPAGIKFDGPRRAPIAGKRSKKSARRSDGRSGLTRNQICRFLEDDGFKYHVRPGHPVVETGFRARTGTFPMVVFLREEPALVCVLVRLSDVVPEEKRPAMAEAVARANYGLSLGCFELDMSDGEMDFRLAMPVGESTLSQDQFRGLLGAAMWTTNRYHRAFSRLLYGDDLSPAEVIAEVEMSDGDEPPMPGEADVDVDSDED